MQKLLKQTIKYSTYLLIFLLPFQTRWIVKAGDFNGGYYEYGTISLYAVDIILILILIFKALSLFVEKNFSALIFKRYNIIAKSYTPPSIIVRSEVTKQSHRSHDCQEVNASVINQEKVCFVWILIGIIEIFIFISCFRAPDKIIALYIYARFLLGVGLFFIVAKFPLCSVVPFFSKDVKSKTKVTETTYFNLFKKDVKKRGREYTDRYDNKANKLVYVFLSATFFQSLLALYQIIAQSTFANKYLGLAKHLPAILGTSVVELADGARWLRAYGGLDHPNMLGGLMVFATMVAIIEFIRISESSFFKGEKIRQMHIVHNSLRVGGVKHRINLLKIETIFLCFSLVLSTITFFFTFSRSAWLALALGIFVMLIFSVIKKQLRMQKAILQAILLIASTLFILFMSFNSLVEIRITGNTRLEQKSIQERSAMNSQAIKIIKDNWLWGVGIGNYTQYLQKINSDNEAYDYQPVHNIIFLVAAEIGVVALFIFIFLILYLFFNQVINHVVYHLNGFLLVPLLVLFLFDHWLWSLHFGVFLFWFILGLAYSEGELSS